MRIPIATYRVQLHKDFNLASARALLPYLEALGISDLYVSPIFQARQGSTHGYDVTNPCVVNPELGTAEDFDALVEDLHRRQMRLLLDIVPNHMAASLENPWWVDVLENGQASPYASYFDVEWEHASPTVRDKIVLPVLGEPYGDALENQKLKLVLRESGFGIDYGGSAYPLDPGTYHDILVTAPTEAARETLREILEIADRLPPRGSIEWESVDLRRRDSKMLKERLWTAYQENVEVKAYLDRSMQFFHGVPDDSASFDALDRLLDRQAFQLTFWRAARERINYRRFFDVTDLIGIRVQDPRVFEATHAVILQWVSEKKVDGLRIDHVDGLYDPLAYLAQLQERSSKMAGEPVYIAVEKILSGTEALHSEWPVAGTTGYEFLGAVNNLFVHPEGLRLLTNTYQDFVGDSTSFYELAYAQKRKIMEDLFAGEMRSLGLHANLIAEKYRHSRDLSPTQISEAMLDVTASMPVYRTYTREFRAGAQDRIHIEDAVSSARRRNRQLNPACFAFVRRLLLLEFKEDEEALRLVMRWQQLSGPVMAKGIEDTTLYLYNRLVSMNDVGGSPEPVSIGEFHAFNQARRQHWPGTMNATSTHDTKRSEDVRARINLLSEMAADWGKFVKRWSRWNQTFAGSDFPRIDPNQEYLLYQTLAGTWPLDDAVTSEYVDRIKNYMTKAAREAKLHTSWLRENSQYEQQMLAFVEAVLTEHSNNLFLAAFRVWVKRLAFFGAVNSLAQTVLKLTAPGVPDFYQGTTFWDFSLVDPDNRRTAQIAPRLEMIGSFPQWRAQELLASWKDGRVKTFVILKSLQVRRELQDVFENGEYLSLTGTGLAEEHVVAAARRRGDRWVIAVVPRFVTGFSALEKFPVGRRIWKEASIQLPDDAPRLWRNAFTGEAVQSDGSLLVANVLADFPVAILTC